MRRDGRGRHENGSRARPLVVLWVTVAVLASGCGPGAVSDDDLARLASDDAVALAAVTSDEDSEQLLFGSGDAALTESVISPRSILLAATPSRPSGTTSLWSIAPRAGSTGGTG